jgi:hypothetical protein
MKTKPVDLSNFKEQFKIVSTGKDSKGNSFNSFGTLNAAAWIGENVGSLIDEIENLRGCIAQVKMAANSGPLRNGLKDDNSMALIDGAIESAERGMFPTP